MKRASVENIQRPSFLNQRRPTSGPMMWFSAEVFQKLSARNEGTVCPPGSSPAWKLKASLNSRYRGPAKNSNVPPQWLVWHRCKYISSTPHVSTVFDIVMLYRVTGSGRCWMPLVPGTGPVNNPWPNGPCGGSLKTTSAAW